MDAVPGKHGQHGHESGVWLMLTGLAYVCVAAAEGEASYQITNEGIVDYKD